jgi:hypothetical protein
LGVSSFTEAFSRSDFSQPFYQIAMQKKQSTGDHVLNENQIRLAYNTFISGQMLFKILNYVKGDVEGNEDSIVNAKDLYTISLNFETYVQPSI